MDRRTFLRTTTAVAATTTMVADSAAAPEQQISAPAILHGLRELSFSSPWSRDVPVFGDMAADLEMRLGNALADRYRIGKGAQGESDLVFAPVDARVASEPGFAFFGAMPGTLGMQPHDLQAWLAVGGGQMLWDDLSAPHGWKPLLAGHSGSQPGLWANDPLESSRDLAGQAVAVSGLGRRVMQAMGATPREMAPVELASALSERRIVAAEWGNPLAALLLGLPHAASHLYRGGIHSAGTAFALHVRAPLWESLGASDRAILEGVAATMFALSTAEARAHRGLAIDSAAQGSSLVISDLPEAIAASINRAARDVVADVASRSVDNTRIYDSYVAFAQLMNGPTPQQTAIS